MDMPTHPQEFEKYPIESKGKKRGYTPTLAKKYPKYYFEVPTNVTHMDVYALMRMVKLTDPVLGHSFKKIMLSGVRTGGKSALKDIIEARDTLNRWIELEGGEDAEVEA